MSVIKVVKCIYATQSGEWYTLGMREGRGKIQKNNKTRLLCLLYLKRFCLYSCVVSCGLRGHRIRVYRRID
ncbi:uncharacterized protein T551_01834 [Pneumocystis jirovecii RU7]|uniref:Uncharacterized protein n=1 Tax=Pneumocystis jirovecii (strain RU7) TaxID=1408657 RepID=A0A0W4ZQ97_PNEJ7|nr:uncharacterized protein T551_01834 [Pneumocystis jirovecii RU7]KTW30551.1 hypothetical protein T551_01834 [Pneumocystis jirovecii RU7]